MEIIGFLILAWIVWSIFSKIVSTGKTVARKVQGKPEPYFGPAEITVTDEKREESGIEFKSVKLRGLIPVDRAATVTVSTHLMDVTEEDNWQPLISYAEALQEDNTIAFQQKQEGISLTPGDSFTSWIQCAVILPSALQAPYKGPRKIAVIVVAYSESDPAALHSGYYDDVEKLVIVKRTDLMLEFEDVGYLEERENSELCRLLSIEIAVAVAMADGALDDTEGEVIRQWMAKNIEFYSGDKQEEMRQRFNTALQNAYSDASDGSLSFSPLCERLKDIGDKKSKYDTIELCMDVMVADGVADPEELDTIKSIAEIIDFDLSEMDRMKEERLIDNNLLSNSENSYHILGIDESWNKREKLKHIRSEFQKWNNRLTSLPEGEERENAQRMLDMIAEVRADLEKIPS